MIISGIVLAGLIILIQTGRSEIQTEESEIQHITQTIETEPDVIMPTKVSRPGCEETNSCYIPFQITIKKGEQVTWLNEDVAFHSVTSGFYGEPTELFDSGHMDPQEKFSVTFSDEGTFDYFCTLHPWMRGQVLVE